MQSLETSKAQLDLYEKALSGDVDALMKCSFMRGLISEKHYREYLESDKMCSEEAVEDDYLFSENNSYVIMDCIQAFP
jgi:hypothetical protein